MHHIMPLKPPRRVWRSVQIKPPEKIHKSNTGQEITGDPKATKGLWDKPMQLDAHAHATALTPTLLRVCCWSVRTLQIFARSVLQTQLSHFKCWCHRGTKVPWEIRPLQCTIQANIPAHFFCLFYFPQSDRFHHTEIAELQCRNGERVWEYLSGAGSSETVAHTK